MNTMRQEPRPPDLEPSAAIDVLVSELQDARKRLTDIMLSSERVLATGVAILAIAANVALAQHFTQPLLFIPLLADGLIAYMAYMYAELFALGGYCLLLEEEISTRTGDQRLAFWETVIAPLRLTAIPRRILQIFVVAIAIGLNAAAVLTALRTRHMHHWGHHHSTLIIVTTLLATVAAATLASAAFVTAWRERDRVYRAGRRSNGLRET
jgi:hypothetical protein